MLEVLIGGVERANAVYLVTINRENMVRRCCMILVRGVDRVFEWYHSNLSEENFLPNKT